MKPNPRIETVLVVFKTHLDLGFTDLAANIERRYVLDFIPRAIQLAEESRTGGRPDHFVWTTGSWLIYQFLEKADKDSRGRMEQAIQAGDIVWHALPFTTHTELLDAPLFRFGLGLSRTLDARFGKKTTAAKMSDVPGHTRSMVPPLAESGVKFLHIGINPASKPPAVPPIFRWREPGGKEVAVMYQMDYGEVMVLPGGTTAIAVSHTGDNMGPPSLPQIDEVYTGLRRRFPNAIVHASTLDQVGEAIHRLEEDLPVVTAELGDSWIHGVGTDPTKVRQFRELCRLRRGWLDAGQLEAGSKTDFQFSLPLLAVAEHTWGMDEKTHLADFSAYRPEEFAALRKEERCRRFESSWAEQRAYVDQALEGLAGTSLASQAKDSLERIKPREPNLDGYRQWPDGETSIETAHFTLAFDERGAITRLKHLASRREWASASRPLGLFGFQTFSQQDFERFMHQYMTYPYDWAIKAFSKVGMVDLGAQSAWWHPQLEEVHSRSDTDGVRILLTMAPPTNAGYGFPKRLTLEIFSPNEEDALYLDLQWFDKPANRLPEASWFSFSPKGVRAQGWSFAKMGCPVSPIDVVKDGGRKLHSIDGSVTYSDPSQAFEIETFDTSLVAPGQPSLLDFNNKPLPLNEGVHFNLHNNVWCTNFPMWFEDDARFRFAFRCVGRSKG